MTDLNIAGPGRHAVFLTDELAKRGFQTRLVWSSSAAGEGRLEPPADLAATYAVVGA